MNKDTINPDVDSFESNFECIKKDISNMFNLLDFYRSQGFTLQQIIAHVRVRQQCLSDLLDAIESTLDRGLEDV